jgi:hypothetical protein
LEQEDREGAEKQECGAAVRAGALVHEVYPEQALPAEIPAGRQLSHHLWVREQESTESGNARQVPAHMATYGVLD